MTLIWGVKTELLPISGFGKFLYLSITYLCHCFSKSVLKNFLDTLACFEVIFKNDRNCHYIEYPR